MWSHRSLSPVRHAAASRTPPAPPSTAKAPCPGAVSGSPGFSGISTYVRVPGARRTGTGGACHPGGKVLSSGTSTYNPGRPDHVRTPVSSVSRRGPPTTRKAMPFAAASAGTTLATSRPAAKYPGVTLTGTVAVSDNTTQEPASRAVKKTWYDPSGANGATAIHTCPRRTAPAGRSSTRSEEHTSELQSRENL